MLSKILFPRALNRCQNGLSQQTEEAGGDLCRTLLRRGYVHPQLVPRGRHIVLMFLSVCRYDGYRYRRRPSPHTLRPVSWPSPSAANSQHCVLRAQRISLHRHLHHLDLEIHALPSDLVAHAPTPSAIALPWHVTHGICNNRKYVRRGLRSSVGWPNTILRVGVVVA